MEITREAWKQIAALLYKYNISYTTNVTNDDKHIQINLTIPIVDARDSLDKFWMIGMTFAMIVGQANWQT